MKIVVLDGYCLNPGDLDWKGLEALGECIVYDRTSLTDMEEVISRIGDADIVYTNKTPMPREVFEKCPNIRFVGVLATGYNVVDVNTAKEKGIPVANIPTYGTASVGQFAIALLLEICHHVGHHNPVVHEGKWESNPDWCFWDYPLIELDGKNMGIIGYGRIGQATGKIAQALGMKVLAYDAYKNPALENENCRYVELDELLSQSDVIALHCPLFPETEGIVNKENIAKMKDGVIMLNNSRGPLMVEQDLVDAPLLGAKNCIITPHISWAPKESRKRLMDIAVNNLEEFLKGSPVNVVNK